MKRRLIATIVLSVLCPLVHAQTSLSGDCPAGTSSCSNSNQNSGDTTTTDNYGSVHDTASQIGGASNSISSGNETSYDNRAQTTQNADNTTTGTITGGDSTSSVGNTSATGNLSTNNNQSSVGNTSSSSGGNTVAGGNNSATTGNNTNTNTASGGAGGSASSTGTNTQGQKQSNQSSNTNQGGNTNSSNSNSTASTGGQSKASSKGGSASNGQANTGAGNSTNTSIGGSSYQDNSKVIIPPPLPGTPPSVVGSTQAVVTVGACGPLVRVTKSKINGTFHGILWDSKVSQGYDESVEPVTNPDGTIRYYDQVTMPDGRIHLIGSQITAFDSVNGTSSARQIGIGTGGSSGGYGQGALGASSANQQQQVRLIVRPCEAGVVADPAPLSLPTVSHIHE